MLSGIRDILLITKPEDKSLFEKLLQNGNKWGLNIHYKTQESPRGIAEALILGEDFLNKSCCTLILGDNLFYGDKLTERIRKNGPNHRNYLVILLGTLADTV